MNIKQFLFLPLFLLASVAAGAGNLVLNGDLAAENKAYPPYWMPMIEGGARMDYHASGGPDGKGFIRLTSTDAAPARVQQNNLKLVKGEKYRIGAWIRTGNLRDKKSGIRVGIGPLPEPDAENSLLALPANQPEWRYYEKNITMPQEEKKLYPFHVVDIVAENGGVLDFSGVKLIPVSEKAKRDSLSQMDNMEQHLVPLGNLSYLNCADAELEFSWTGPMPGKKENLDAEFYFSKDQKTVKVPFNAERSVVKFGTLASGRQDMRIRVLDRVSGKVLFEETYPVRGVTVPEKSKSAKKLNNLVTELYSGNIAAGKSVQFANERYGFVFFKIQSRDNQPFELLLNGKKIADSTSLNSETIRDLDPGIYHVTVKGAACDLVIRQIPDVLTFALWTPRMPGNGNYNWEFAKKYLIPGLTTINVAGFTDEQFAQFDFWGRKFLENYGIQNWSNPNIPEDNLARMQKDRVFSNPKNHGTTMDESEFWYPVMLDPYAYALKKFANPHNKLIVTYQTGPLVPSYMNVLSAAANASNGRAYLAFEYYPRGQRNMQEVQNMLDMVSLHWQIYRDTAPGLFDRAGIAWGNFSCSPNISLAHYPDIDYKYILDMKMHHLANAPAFDGLSKVGFWGTYAADEEIARWSFKLMRHYAFEGKKEMLSGKYGFTLKPGHLKNPAFTAGLDNWSVRGNVVPESFPGYGKKSLLFHGSTGAGDDFALFTRTADSHGEISQKLTGLKKGRRYLMYFYVGNYDDIINRVQKPGALPLTWKLDGVKVAEKVHYTGNYTKSKEAYVNIHKVIFEALSPEAVLTFSNASAAPGSRLALNYVCIRPYFEAEDLK